MVVETHRSRALKDMTLEVEVYMEVEFSSFVEVDDLYSRDRNIM